MAGEALPTFVGVGPWVVLEKRGQRGGAGEKGIAREALLASVGVGDGWS